MGRESIQVSYAFKQIIDSGVRLFFYMTDQERRLDNALDKIMLSLSTFVSEMEREKASQRIYDAMFAKPRCYTSQATKCSATITSRSSGMVADGNFSAEEPQETL